MILYLTILFSINIFAQSISDSFLDAIIYNKTDEALNIVNNYDNDLNLLKPYNGANILSFVVFKHNYKLLEALINRAKKTKIDVEKFVNIPEEEMPYFYTVVKPLELAVDIYIGTLNCCNDCIDCQTTHQSEYMIINLLFDKDLLKSN